MIRIHPTEVYIYCNHDWLIEALDGKNPDGNQYPGHVPEGMTTTSGMAQGICALERMLSPYLKGTALFSVSTFWRRSRSEGSSSKGSTSWSNKEHVSMIQFINGFN